MDEREGPEAPVTPPARDIPDPGSHVSGKRAAKKKVSLTIDESLLEEIRAIAGGRPLSGVVNELLAKALAQGRLAQLVAEMEAEAGPAPPEVYEQILDEWERGVNR